MKKYIPIACGSYDILTLHSMHQDIVYIKFSQGDMECGFSERIGIITNIFTKDGAEYLQLNNEEPIFRLDHILEIRKRD